MAAGLAATASADVSVRAKRIELDYWLATTTDAGGLSLERLTIRPTLRLDLARHWQFDGRLRIELADSRTGLGTTETYDGPSRPLRFGDDHRAEIDRATLSWRRRGHRITLGKQTVAWGVLDGLQITDRFDAKRRRDAVFSEQRPERLSRWGARYRFARGDWGVDLAGAFDGTVDQLPRPGDAFFPLAPRLRGGLPAAASLPPLTIVTPERPTLGVRVTRTIGQSDISVLTLRGPDTEPVFESTAGGIEVAFPVRHLVGATWQRSAGARVWRLEVAHVPNQAVNVLGATVARFVSRKRTLAGAGLDWRLPANVLLNAQIGVDQVDPGGERLVRPTRDVITTWRLQHLLANDQVRISTEVIASLTDGDVVVRPAVRWQINDHWRVAAGLDWIDGDPAGLFGQYEDASRVWLRATLTL